MAIAVYAGSFDPITLSHVSVIKRAAKDYEKLIVLIALSPDKASFLSVEERLHLAQEAVAGLPNVEVDTSVELVATYARAHRAKVLVRGVRSSTDIEAEIKIANLNHDLDPNLETVFVPADRNLQEATSSQLRAWVAEGKDVSKFCAPSVEAAIRERLSGSLAP